MGCKRHGERNDGEIKRIEEIMNMIKMIKNENRKGGGRREKGEEEWVREKG